MKMKCSQPLLWVALEMLILMGTLLVMRQANAAENRQSTPAEVTSLVGTFVAGGGFGGGALTLKADHTFTYEVSDDTVMDVKWSGHYEIEHNLLTLHPSSEIAISQRESKIINADGTVEKLEYHWSLQALHCVVWEKRLYLIADREMPAFCNDVNLGREPRGTHIGEYFVQSSWATLNHLPPVADLPFVPAPWKEFLLPKPVVARVVAVEITAGKAWQNGNGFGALIVVTLNKGTHSGLKPGMEFALPKGFDRTMVVRNAQSDQCVAELEPLESNLKIAVGTQFSTRLNKRTLHYYRWSSKINGGG